jgi:hypothetical protein
MAGSFFTESLSELDPVFVIVVQCGLKHTTKRVSTSEIRT